MTPGSRAVPLLALALLLAVLLALGAGAVPIAPGQAAAILLEPLGLRLPVAVEDAQRAALLAVRLPRVLLGALVGAALALSGTLLQALFRNPLADPALLGVSGGAALATAAGAVLGLAGLAARASSGLGAAASGAATALAGTAAAFAGGLLATFCVWRLGRVNGRVRSATLLLAGLAVSALAGAGTGLMLYAADDAALRDITFWMLGSLGGATWGGVSAAAPVLLLAALLALRLARPLDVLLLGEAPAGHLGLDVPRVQRRVVVAATLATGAAVAVAGAVGFVGLLVPHLLRRLLGARHARLLPCAALAGATLVLLADLVARTAVAPAELPLGVVTALLGAPAFLVVLRRARPEAR